MPGTDGSGLIDRPDLLAALDAAAAKRVTLVAAPAGSGKTSLLRAWAARAAAAGDRRVAFLSVRPGQRDGQLFWLALLAAVRAAVQAAAGAGTGASSAAEPPAAPGLRGDALVDAVLAELAGPGRPFALVLDDLHELASPEAVAELTRLLASLPPGVHAILAARSFPPLHLHQLRLAGDLAEIRGGQLRFTDAETRRFLADAGIDVPADVAALLRQRTEGWAAGLRLAALSMAGHPDPARFVAEFSGSDRTVEEYLMAELLERQPAEVQELLLRTSVLERVNGELADLLGRTTGSERILLELEDANAFVVSVDPGRTCFRYHRMFAELLRLELRRRLPAEIPELHRLAAGWLAARGQPAEAIGHRQAAGDWADAARLLADHALSLTLDGQAGTVEALLGAFPSQVGEDTHGLALVRAIADLDQMRLDQAAARLQVAWAYAAAEPPARRRRLELALASLELLLARLSGHFNGVFEQVETLLSPPAEQAEVALELDLRALALLNLGVAEAWSLRLADSERHLLEGAGLAGRIGRPYLEVACLAHLGFASTYRSLALTRRRCREAIAVAAGHGWDAGSPVIAPALAALANALIWTGQFDQGERWLERARRATEADGEPGVRLLVALTSAILAAARGRQRLALAEFAAVWQVQTQMMSEHALTVRAAAWTIAAQARLGMLDEARAGLAELDRRQCAGGEIRTAAAVVRLAEHDPAAARRELRGVLDGSVPVYSYFTQVEAHLVDALACRALGDEDGTGQAVGRALSLAEPDRLILPFAMTGAWELLESAPPPTGPQAALAAAILDAVHDRAPAADADRPPPAAGLSASELRVLRYLPTNLTRSEIAADLSVSPNTVSTHLRRIYAKLGATDRSSAVQRGRELRLLSSGRS